MPFRHLPARRVRVALAGLALIALTRAIGYAVPGRNVQDPLLYITFDGALLPIYVIAWAIAGILCLWDMRRPTLHGWGPPMTIGLMAAWAAAYLAGQAVAVFLHHDWPLWWQTSALYAGAALTCLALLAPESITRKHPRRTHA